MELAGRDADLGAEPELATVGEARARVHEDRARVHAPHDSGLESAFSAPARHGTPSIQVAPSEGKALELFARMVGARRAVEVGTLVGYSAIHIARGLAKGGRLWTIEQDPKHATLAREHLLAAGVAEQVEVVQGAAAEMLPSLEVHGPFDMVFIDADKLNYLNYYEAVLPLLRSGGLVVADNVLWSGRVLNPVDESDKAIHHFNETVIRDARVEQVMLPIRDGIYCIRKK